MQAFCIANNPRSGCVTEHLPKHEWPPPLNTVKTSTDLIVIVALHN